MYWEEQTCKWVKRCVIVCLRCVDTAQTQQAFLWLMFTFMGGLSKVHNAGSHTKVIPLSHHFWPSRCVKVCLSAETLPSAWSLSFSSYFAVVGVFQGVNERTGSLKSPSPSKCSVDMYVCYLHTFPETRSIESGVAAILLHLYSSWTVWIIMFEYFYCMFKSSCASCVT